MCRHLAYIGAPRHARDAGRSTRRTRCSAQSCAPREQRHGAVNADGFGVGWYAPDARRAGPLPAGAADLDRRLVRLARADDRSRLRRWPPCAPPPPASAVDEAVRRAVHCRPLAVQPQRPASTTGRGLGKVLPTGRPTARRPRRRSTPRCCSALPPTGWPARRRPGGRSRETVEDVLAVGGGRLNLLATDGSRSPATTYGDPLFVRATRRRRRRRLRAVRRRPGVDRGPRRASS